MKLCHIGGPIRHHWMLIKYLILLKEKHRTGHQMPNLKSEERHLWKGIDLILLFVFSIPYKRHIIFCYDKMFLKLLEQKLKSMLHCSTRASVSLAHSSQLRMRERFIWPYLLQLNYWQVTDSGRWRFVILSCVATGDPPGSNGQFQIHGSPVFPRYPWGTQNKGSWTWEWDFQEGSRQNGNERGWGE